MKFSLFLLPALSYFAVAAPAQASTDVSTKSLKEPNFAPDLVKDLTAKVKPLIADISMCSVQKSGAIWPRHC